MIDFGIQAFINTLDGTSWEDAISEVDYGNVAWATATIHINQTKANYVLNCIRQATQGMVNLENRSLSDALKRSSSDCILEVALIYISNGIVSGTEKYSDILLDKLSNSPKIVTDKLLNYGINKTVIRNFKNMIAKESIRITIENSIKQYER